MRTAIPVLAHPVQVTALMLSYMSDLTCDHVTFDCILDRNACMRQVHLEFHEFIIDFEGSSLMPVVSIYAEFHETLIDF